MFAWIAKIVLPDWAKKALLIAGAVTLAIAAFLWWLDSYGDKRVADHERTIDAELVKASEAATVRASEAVAEHQADTAASNAKARKAAAEADDPLKAAMDALR